MHLCILYGIQFSVTDFQVVCVYFKSNFIYRTSLDNRIKRKRVIDIHLKEEICEYPYRNIRIIAYKFG